VRRRTGWLVGGAVAVVLLAGAAALLWPRGDAAPQQTPSSSPVATSAPPIDAQAQDRLDEHLAACASSTGSTPPEHCGISIPWGTEFASVTGIRYRIEKLPTVVIDGDAFTAEGGVLVATVTGTGQDGAARSETYQTSDWAVRGDLVVEDGVVSISVW